MNFPPAPPHRSPLNFILWGVVGLLVLTSLLSPKKAAADALLLVLAAILVAMLVAAPRRLRYEFTPEGLNIHRVVGAILLPYHTLSARHSAGHLSVRTFGVGLPGYLTGYFLLAGDPQGAGQVQVAASRGSEGVLLHTGKQAYFVTPADPEAFLAELARRGAKVRP